ncbi:MAG: HAMP domain-containing sensor histidine kinase [Pleurocapsa sp. MO_226.B13]|nr:HAMP domain-containing sensor histidine kinase [Pleurocapsa sp. MO_226.B13]
MKWHSISTRLILMLLGLTLGSVTGFSIVLDIALKNFFVRDAQTTLQRQANVLANQAQAEPDPEKLRQWANLIAQQGQWQVIVFNGEGKEWIKREGVLTDNSPQPPAELIAKTLTGSTSEGRFKTAENSQYPWWLYGTAPLYLGKELFGAVYIAMPMRRPKQFAQQVEGVVVGMVLVTTTITVLAAWLLSRSFTQPLERLHQQAKLLGAGDYTARSGIKGKGELAQLSHSVDEMAAKLSVTLEALKAQETSRRQLVANVSHDLRTPLASLRVELEAILDGVVSGEKASQYLKRACRETDYLARLVEQLMLLARADAGQLQINPQAVSAVAIAQECLSRMEVTAHNAHLNLELLATPDLPQVWVDPELTGQVVLNLIDNAIKYAPDSEVIDIEVLPPVTENKGNYVPLQVRDRGSGMKPEEIKQVTERFYRTNSARPKGGFGLGLAIAHQVCHLQGGSLQIESQLAKGTVVRLLLPTQ